MEKPKTKLTIHPVPKKLWHRLKFLQDHQLDGEVVIEFEAGKVKGWHVVLKEEHDGEQDVALQAST